MKWWEEVQDENGKRRRRALNPNCIAILARLLRHGRALIPTQAIRPSIGFQGLLVGPTSVPFSRLLQQDVLRGGRVAQELCKPLSLTKQGTCWRRKAQFAGYGRGLTSRTSASLTVFVVIVVVVVIVLVTASSWLGIGPACAQSRIPPPTDPSCTLKYRSLELSGDRFGCALPQAVGMPGSYSLWPLIGVAVVEPRVGRFCG